MFLYKRILVGLDHTDLDITLIRYASYLVQLFEATDVYFYHVVKPEEIPEGVKGFLKQEPLNIQDIENQLKGAISTHYNSKLPYKIFVEEGNPTEKLLRWSSSNEVELIMVGRKMNSKGSGILPGKLAKLSHCSVLQVPEDSIPDVSNILVPIDFSDYSRMALEEAIGISGKTSATIHCQHVYKVPTGYHYSGKSYREFADIMKKNAEKDMTIFLKKNKLEEYPLENHFVLGQDHDLSEKIYGFAQVKKTDMIVVGSKGRTAVAALLLGSLAEKLMIMENDIPLLIVKKRGENMNFLKALLEL
ncbi:MAG: universal stress protein [Bacteroidota bacterium]